jgi:NACHT domain
VLLFGMLVLVVGSVGFFASQELDKADKWASVGSFVLGALGLVVTVLGLRVTLRQASPTITQRLDQLANVMKTQWEDEAERRGLNHPLPLSVRWVAADPVLMDRLSTVVGGPIPASEESHFRDRYLSGQLAEVAEVFARLPTRRLVVLGEPGAGKTVLAVQLILALLRQRAPGQPVPVLLTLGSWNPVEQHPHAWMAAQLEQTYPALRAPADEAGQPKMTMALHLVRTRNILPILDGLDEMSEHLRGPALRALNQILAATGLEGKDPLMLTCRAREYRDILTPGAAAGAVLTESSKPGVEPLAAAAAVELCRLNPNDIQTYLLEATPEHQVVKWNPVFTQLNQQPDGPLAQALSTPLMSALARIAYSQTTANPADLLDPKFTSRTQVEGKHSAPVRSVCSAVAR